MGENSTTLGDQVGSPRVVPILRLRTRFFHIRRVFVRFRSFSFVLGTRTPRQRHNKMRFWDSGILRQYRET